MHIVVASTVCPTTAGNGLQLQLAGLLGQLVRRHEVVLVTEAGPADDLVTAQGLCGELVVVPPASGRLTRLRQEVSTALSQRPVLAEQVTSSPIADALAAQVRRRRPDVVHLTPGWTAELVERVDGVPVVLAPLDATGPNQRADVDARTSVVGRYLARRELDRLLRFEARTFPRCEEVVVVTERDAGLLRANVPGLRPRVVPNGVDVERWRRPSGVERKPGLIVFSGAMNYAPNVSAAVLAANLVLPEIRRQVPGAHLRLVGRDPAPQVRGLAGQHVEVTGTVDDVRAHLWQAAVYLCPMGSGSGIKNKLLEALAAGCPSVVTPTAAEGTGVVDGMHAVVALEAPALAEGVTALLRDPGTSERLAVEAALLAGTLSWARTAEGFEAAYRAAVERPGS